jgi:hypothetical protein
MSGSVSAFTEGLKMHSQFLVFSHSWTGKMALVFGMNEDEIILFDATTPDAAVKERWLLVDIKDVSVSEKNADEFTIELANNSSSWSVRKSSKWTFSCLQRTSLVAVLLELKDQAAGGIDSASFLVSADVVNTRRRKVRVTLKVGAGAIEAQHKVGGKSGVLFELHYENLAAINIVTDAFGEENGFAVRCQSGRAYVLVCSRRDEVIYQIQTRVLRLGTKTLAKAGVDIVGCDDLGGKSATAVRTAGKSSAPAGFVALYDWASSGPEIGEHLPLASFESHRVSRCNSPGPNAGHAEGVSVGAQSHDRCMLVLKDDCVADVDPDRNVIIEWWKLDDLFAIVCSTANAARLALVHQHGFFQFDCRNRDGFLTAILHRCANSTSIKIILGDVQTCQSLLRARVVSVAGEGADAGSRRGPAFLAAAEGIYVRRLGSIRMGDGGEEHAGAMDVVVMDAALSAVANLNANRLEHFADRQVLCGAISVLAQQINATSFGDNAGARHAVLLLEALSTLLASAGCFESFLDIPNVVVMINRFFRMLSGASLVAPSASPMPRTPGNKASSVDTGPSRSLLLWHILKTLNRMVTFNSPFNEKTHSAEKINEVEKHCRGELVSFQRAKLLINLLESACRSVAGGPNKSLNGAGGQSNGRKNDMASVLVVHGLLEILCDLVCAARPSEEAVVPGTFLNHHDNTSPETRESILKLLANHNILLGLFAFDASSINELAAMLMKEIVLSNVGKLRQKNDFVSNLRRNVLCDGTALSHFHSAVFGHNKRVREQSKFMFSLWMDDFPEGLELINNMLPDVFFNIVTERGRAVSPTAGMGQPATELSPRWERFFLAFDHDHRHPKLVWDTSCREELRIALENEIRLLDKRRAKLQSLARSAETTTQDHFDDGLGNRSVSVAASVITWNYKEFRVKYKAHKDAAKLGHYFLEPLVAARNSNAETFPIEKMEAPYLFHLIHSGILKEIVKKSPTQYKDNKVLGIYLQVLEAIVQFHHDGLAPARIGEAMDTIAMLLTSLSELVGRKPARPIDDGAAELQSGEPVATVNIEYAFNVISKALRAVQTLDRLFPDEIINFVDSGGLEACVKILSLVPSAVPGSPESMLGSTCLETLRGICSSHPVLIKGTGAVVWPLPSVRRALSSEDLFNVLVACLLANDERVIGQTAYLIALVVDSNPELIRKLYLSGAYYFALIYDGSDQKTMESIAYLLKSTHEKQVYPLKDNVHKAGQKSYLSFILPDALVCYLSSHDVKAFASVLVGDYDNPEAIWSPEMRAYMVGELKEHVREHVSCVRSASMSASGSFDYSAFCYEYDPLPPMHYPQLNEEMYCSGYYLRNLCNVQRFPNWEIHDPAELLRSVLDAWRAENAKSTKDGSVMSFIDAANVLEIDVNASDITLDKGYLRKTYFKLARKFHPDRNPHAPKEQFERINEAYERLMLLVGGRLSAETLTEACDLVNISLLLKTQIVLYSQYSGPLKRFKYPMYGVLMKIVEAGESATEGLSALAVKLMACTSTVHEGNATELLRWNGFDVVTRTLRSTIGDDQRRDLYEACMIAVSAFSLIPEGRAAVASSYLVVAAVHEALASSTGEVNNVIRAAFRTAANISIEGTVKERSTFVEKGLVFTLIAWALGRENEEQHSCAYIALQCLFALAGYRKPGEVGKAWDSEHTYVRGAIEGLLSRPLFHVCTKLMIGGNPSEDDGRGDCIEKCLALIHSERFSPTLIWNREMRNDVVDYVMTRASELSISNFMQNEDADPDEENAEDPAYYFNKTLNPCKDFKHEILRGQILVGEVYLHPFVSQSERFERLDSLKFTKDLLEHIRNTSANVHIMVYQSLQYLLDEMSTYKACIALMTTEHVAVLFRLVDKLRKTAPSSSARLGGGQPEDDLSCILSLDLNLSLLSAISKSSVACGLMLDAGAPVDLLYIIIDGSYPMKERVMCSFVFAQTLSQRTTKAQDARGSLLRLLPRPLLNIFTNVAMASNVPMEFDKLHDTPELQWDGTCRGELRAAVSHLKSELFQESQVKGVASIRWKMPGEDVFQLSYTLHHGRFVVAGVFVKRFLKDPGSAMTTPLSNPLEFGQGLVATMKQTMSANEKDLKYFVLSCQSFVALLKHYPMIADELSSLGIVPDFFKMLGALAGSGANVVLCECFLRNTLALCSSRVAVEHAAAANGVPALVLLLHSSLPSVQSEGHATPSSRLASQCLALIERLVIVGGDMKTLMKQISSSECLKTLIEYLEWESRPHLPPSAEDDIDYSVHLRVFSVSIVKRLATNPHTGASTRKFLEKIKIWARYKNQDESLYLTQHNVVELLEGGNATKRFLEDHTQ